MTELRDDKPLWGLGEVVRIAIPAAAGMVGATIMQFVDGLMVSRMVGPQALSAQFAAGILSFVPACFALGTFTVVNTYVSQNFGAGRLPRCAQYAWHGLYLAAVYGLLFMPVAGASDAIFGFVGRTLANFGGDAPSPEEVAMQSTYFRYLLLGTPLMLMARVMGQFFFGTHRPWIVVLVTVCAVGVNAAVNYVLIKGLWGLPAMGLKGAAIGTIIGWGFSLALLLAAFLRRSENDRFRTRLGWPLRMRFCADIVRVGWPAGTQFLVDVLAWSVVNNMLVGYFGQIHKAASAAAVRYMHVSFMPAVGIGIAATAVVGRCIGMGRKDLARRRAHAAVALAVAYMGLCALTFLILRYPMIRAFAKAPESMNVDPAKQAEIVEQIVHIGTRVLICAAVFQCFDGIAIVFIGALRGAGDTFWPMIVTFVLSWGIVVGGGVAMVRFAPQLESIGPWVAGAVFVIVLGIVMALRFESGAWRKIDLLGRRGVRTAPAGVAPQPETPAVLGGPMDPAAKVAAADETT